jgi:hypothetical protein
MDSKKTIRSHTVSSEPKRYRTVEYGEFFLSDDPLYLEMKRKAEEAQDWQDALHACEGELANLEERFRQYRESHP